MLPNRWILVVALSLASAGGGSFLFAQQGVGGPGLGLYGLGPRLGENVMLALEIRDQLELSDDQIRSLQLLQDGIRKDVEPLESEIADLRGMIQSGEVKTSDGLVQLQTLFAEYQAVAEPYRTQVATVLTPGQHEALMGIMWDTRALPGQTLETPGTGWIPPLGTGQATGLRQGLGVRLGRGVGSGLARGTGLGLGRGVVFGGGRGMGRRASRGSGWRWWY